MQRLIVTIDGPAGSGKSTVAQLLARRMKLCYLDTGAMYRALAVRCIESRIHTKVSPQRVEALAAQTRIEFDWSTDPPRLLVDGRDLSARVRDPDVTQAVGDVAAIPGVRAVLVDQQQRIGRQHPRLITEGRDQGSVVFPDAEAKFYLDASLDVRAQRRAAQFRQSGHEARKEEVQAAIAHRDDRDRGRSEGPLDQPDDAIHIDSSSLTLDQVVDQIIDKIEARLELNPRHINVSSIQKGQDDGQEQDPGRERGQATGSPSEAST